VFGPQLVSVVLVREAEDSRGYDLALVTTDPQATAGQAVQRYASRWAVEVSIEDAKQLAGVGQAHNRKALAVERTVPFGLACLTLAVCWYATAGHQPADVAEHRARRPWYRTKTNPSTADMLAPSSAASSSPPDFALLDPNSRHQKKSRPTGWPGRIQRHNGET